MINTGDCGVSYAYLPARLHEGSIKYLVSVDMRTFFSLRDNKA